MTKEAFTRRQLAQREHARRRFCERFNCGMSKGEYTVFRQWALSRALKKSDGETAGIVKILCEYKGHKVVACIDMKTRMVVTFYRQPPVLSEVLL